jgi:ADP-ribose pyrophosphatase
MATSDPQTLLETKRFQVVRVTRTSPAGKVHTREYIEHPGAVTIVPVLPDGRICLVRNYRLAVDQTLLELPAGTLDAGETPSKTAERELAEETGYLTGRLEPLCEFYMSPGILNERMSVFVASELVEGPPHREETEEIENLLVPLAEALRMVDVGEIRDSKTIAALLLYARRKSLPAG